jgi:hypothetical protein
MLSFLKELDELATTTVSLHCIGGFVVTMLYGLSRTTGAYIGTSTDEVYYRAPTS